MARAGECALPAISCLEKYQQTCSNKCLPVFKKFLFENKSSFFKLLFWNTRIGNLFYFEGKSKNDVLESNAPID